MSKMIAYDQDALEAIKRGVGTLSRAVTKTLGPRGRNVLLQKSFGPPVVTKDGVTVAKEIDLEDPFENIGARIVREVASKTNDVAGDGTTTATVLAEAIFNEGLRAVIGGIRPVHMKQGIEQAVDDIVAKLKANSVPVKGKDDLTKVASIAANNDPTIGQHVADALDRVGKDGVVTLDEGKTMRTEIEVVEGMQFDKGYLSPYFVTDASKMECVLEEPYILVHEKKITSIKDIVPLLEKVVQAGRSLLIVAEDVEREALATLVVNRLRGTFQCCAVKAPAYGDRRKAMMEDLAILTGGTAIFESLGIKLESLPLTDLGQAKQVIVDKDNTKVIQGGGKKADIQARIAQIQHELEKSTSDYDREKLEERMPDGGSLSVRCTSDDGQAIVEVTDSGEGIAAADLERVFEPLYTRKTKGIGLGLAVSKRYAEMNRGQLDVESELACGCSFRWSPSEGRQPMVETSGLNLLVVDDEPDMRSSLWRILRVQGHQVAVAESGEQAVDYVRDNEPDGVLMDIRMPGIGGVEAFRKIREASPDTFVIFMTAYSEAAEEARDEGANVLPKPLDVEGICELIEETAATRPILVVDDDTDFCSSLERVLAGKGYDVQIANTPAQAIGFFQKQPRALVLLDMKLNGAAGLEVLHELKQLNAAAVVVQMSGYSELEEDMRQGLEMNAYGYLTKPFDGDQMLAMLQQAMREPKK
ncbi:60 kDa chaperonin 1 [Bremerella volcania]|uniref:60 kDa chaperonin n=1 Tax=Bremerella volcania TaxID=2527984 RepID=A0A518C5U2_9BACT|nr:chaperonin GroEL [Bremerella volcania]QDU74595.1 60 kDa chaperonin 1 [Bremerella volcania]